jgi:hypothetical protein
MAAADAGMDALFMNVSMPKVQQWRGSQTKTV